MVERALVALEFPFEILPCDPDLADTAAFCEAYGLAPIDSANTIVVASRKDPIAYCACVALATTRLDVNHKVCELMGVKKASFARSEDTLAQTGMLIGGVTPFGLPPAWPVYVDAAVMDRPWVIVGGGNRSSKIRIAPDVFNSMPAATVVSGLAVALPSQQ